MQSLETFLQLAPEQKNRTVIRSDSGFGCDYNVDYILDTGWQMLTKGYGGKRTARLMRSLAAAAWVPVRGARWAISVADAPTYLRPTQYFLLRWQTSGGEIKHSSLICSVLDWSLPEIIECYDYRASCETQIQADKGGLKIGKRRKIRLPAQEALVLLTDVAHNLLSWSSAWMFPTELPAAFGTTRLIEDILALPGCLLFDDQGRLVEVQLHKLHPYAEVVAAGLERLLDRFGNP